MDESEYCNRIAIMANGKLAAIGTPKELKESYSSNSMNDVFIQIARGKNYV
jgi:ABC-2 type transport system ATP-binding protein